MCVCQRDDLFMEYPCYSKGLHHFGPCYFSSFVKYMRPPFIIYQCFLIHEDLKTYSKRFMKLNGNPSLKLRGYGEISCPRMLSDLIQFMLLDTNLCGLVGMSIVSLMIWLLMPLKVMAAMYGPAKIMMEMSRVIS